MATLPSLEQLLVSLGEVLGIRIAASGRHFDLYLARRNPAEQQQAITRRLAESLIAETGLDPADGADGAEAVGQLLEFGKRYATIENLLATANATPAQMAWLIGGWIVAPYFGRKFAFRQLQSDTGRLADDRVAGSAGKSDGESVGDSGATQSAANASGTGPSAAPSWFLPVAGIDRGQSRVALPVEQVLGWLDGLLAGGLSGATHHFGAGTGADADANIDAHGQIAGWRGGQLPDCADIRALFGDDAQLQFSDPANAPAIAEVRRRLLIARAVQAVYFALGQLLDGAQFDARNADRQTNHALQLFDLFSMACNLTLAAARANDDPARQDADFERRIPEYLRYGAFASIQPSRQGRAIREALQMLERRFGQLAPDAPLGNLLAYSPQQHGELMRETADFLHSATDAHERLDAAKADLRNKPHWKRVELLAGFDLVLGLARDRDFALPVRQMLLRRAAQLADTPARELELICVELAQRLDGEDRRHRGDDAAAEVEALLARARANPAAAQSAPALAQFEALHAIALGDFDRAARAFDAALAAAGSIGIGRQRTLLAHDAFALRAGRPWRDTADIEGDFHRLVSYGLFLGKPADALPDFDSWAAEAARHFRTELHWPYAGPLRREPRPAESMRKWIEAVSKFGAARDWPGLTRWLGHNLKPGKAPRDAHGDTLLTLLLATRATFLDRARELEAVAPDDKALALLAGMRERWPELLVTVVRACPWLAGESDFALRTPLMLAAAAGDAATVAALLDAGAPADAQDALGRSALHAAVAGGSADCQRLLLAAAPQLAGLTDARGRTAEAAPPATA